MADIDLFYADLDAPSKYDRLELPHDELEASKRLVVPEKREHSLRSRRLFRGVLADYLKEPASELRFERLDHGKPRLLGHALEFNLSHSGPHWILAVTRDPIPLGIDVELTKDDRQLREIAHRYFSPDEIAYIDRAPKELATRFYRLWTRKEALIKCTGKGMKTPLHSFSVLGNELDGIQIRDLDELSPWTKDSRLAIALKSLEPGRISIAPA